MKSRKLFFLLLFLSLLFIGVEVTAQSLSTKGVESMSVTTYKKVSGEGVRERRVVKEEVVKKRSAATVQKTQKKKKAHVIDSVRFSPEPYLLGERIIMPGDSGRDVRSVAQLLVNKLYIDEADLIYSHDGGVVYKGELVRAVKHFQEFHGFYVDGIIGSALIKALRKKIER